MNQKKRLTRRIILSSFMLFIVCSVFSSQETNTIQNSIILDDPTQTLVSSAFEGTGRYFNITQHATAVSSTYDVNPTTISKFTLTNGWTAENITIDCENVTRYQNLIVDGSVQYLSGTYTYWDYNEYDTSGGNSLNPDYKLSMLSLDVGEYTGIVAGNWAYFNQIVTVDEEEISNRIIDFSFDYRIRRNGVSYNGASLYAAIIIGGVEHNVTYGFGTLSYEDFYTINIQYYLSDEGQSLPNDVEFRIGVYINNNNAFGDERNDVHFSNIEYNIWTNINEPNILVAEDSDDFTDYYYLNSSAGQGSFTIDVQKLYGSTQDVSFTITDSTSDVILIDNLTISADLTRMINSSFSSFQDGAFPGSDDILWTFDGVPSIPVSYTDRWVEIEKPDDWEIISVIDPFLTNRTSSCTNLEYGTIFFMIPSDVFSSGDWQIRARSKSWFDDAKLEYWNGASFEERTEFYVNDNFRFKVDINDTVTFANTLINFTLYHPNGTVLWEESEEPSSTEYYFGNFTIGTYNMSVGTYTGEVAWTNNLSSSYVDKVGYKTFEFDVIHHTSFTAINPNIETVPGEALLILVTYEDMDLNQGIDLATVEYNSTFGQTGSLQYAGGGYYFLDLDTSALDYTDYYLSLNASKSYYDNHTESDFVHLSIEREGMILDVSRQVNSVSANSYALFDFNLTGEISEAFLSTNNITTDWIAPYSIVEQSLGQYQLNVSTWGVTSGSFPETYIINIMANKTNYSDISDVVLLQVNPIATNIAVSTTFIRVSAGYNFTVKASYTYSGNGTQIEDAVYTVIWDKEFGISPPEVDGFDIEFNTTGLELDQYTATIICNKSGYQARTKFITVLVDPIKTSLVANTTNIISVYQGKPCEIAVNYTIDDTGDPIPAINYYISWIQETNIIPTSHGFDIEFNTTGLDGQYTSIVYVNKSGYEARSLIFTILVQPLPAELVLLNVEPGEIFIGDLATIGVEYIVDGLSFNGGTVELVGDIEGNLLWNGTAYTVDLDTSSLDSKTYICQITAEAPGVQKKTYELFIHIQDVELEILDISTTYIEISDDSSNLITFSVYDSSHGIYVLDANITCNLIGKGPGIVVSLGNGTYTINLNQFHLTPSIDPYSLEFTVVNPNGENVSSPPITVSYPRNLNLVWWIAGAVAGTALLGLSSLFVYNRYIKQTRFQRDVAFIRKNITNLSKIKSRTEPDRDKMVSEIINKEIDQLL